MNKEKLHWTFWVGIGFLIAGGISWAILLAGEGPPSFVEETITYSYGWVIFGIILIIYSTIKKIAKSKEPER
ncbi:hypothetical protein [Nitrosopumilus sp.]|uniref:hypothetical protein n=1 Tax=Nitrosopumilus sp. TaxID=2024843 RepID=UPI003D110C73